MSDLIEQDNEDVSLQVPQGLEGPDDINLWYNPQGVAKANAFYHTRMVDGNSNQINEAKRFRDQLENAYHEAEIGSSPKVRKLRKSTISIHQNMQRVNDYLYLSSEGETRHGQLEDLGDERLNRMSLLLDSRFQRMERRMERIMERGIDIMKRDMDVMKRDMNVMKRDMNEGFKKLEKQQKNSTYRMENKFKGKGGTSEQNAYNPIVNNDNKFPAEDNLEPLISLSQIHSLNTHHMNNYLGFYGLSQDGNLKDKQIRLETFIGVNVQVVTSTKTEEGSVI